MTQHDYIPFCKYFTIAIASLAKNDIKKSLGFVLK